LPVLSEEAAVHPADDRAALVAPLDEVLERMECTVLTFRRAACEPRWRLPGRDRRLLGRPAQVHAGRAAYSRLDLVAAHEPGVDAGTGGDRLPDLLRRGVDLDLVGELERVCHLRSPPCPSIVRSPRRRASGSGAQARSRG